MASLQLDFKIFFIATVKTRLSYEPLSGALRLPFDMIHLMTKPDHSRRSITRNRKAGRFSTLAVAMMLPVLSIPSLAQAQLRVDTRLYASSGSCSQCDLSGKRMNGMTLKNANFSGSLFNNSNLSGGKLDGSDLTEAHFKKALLYGVTGQQVIMRGAVLEDATLTDAALSHSIMRQANLHRADISSGQFHNNDFRSANLISASAQASDFSHSNFNHARLDNADFSGAILNGAHFNGTRFGFTNLTSASLIGANLSDADLTQSIGLTQAQLDGACGNMNTRLPDGLHLSYCEGVTLEAANRSHHDLPTEVQRAAARLDRAIIDIETLLSVETNAPTRTRLQRIHRDLSQTRDALTR